VGKLTVSKFKTAKLMAAAGLLVAGSLSWGLVGVEAAQPHAAVQQPQTIISRELDVTGDGQKDIVTLSGSKADPNSPYFTALTLGVRPSGKSEVLIPIEGGYNPKLQFVDVTGDKLREIYVSVETGGSGGFNNTYIYSLKNSIPVALPLPLPLKVTAEFQKNYAVKLKIEETNEAYLISIKDKKAEYDQAGIYQNGKVLKQMTVTVNTYSVLEPKEIDRNGIYGLQGIQRITGLYNADTIAYVNSIWKWHNNKWKLLDADIRK
jgi:hypothetical protein